MVLYIETKYKYSEEEKNKIKQLMESTISSSNNTYVSGSVQYLDLIKELQKELNFKLLPRHNHSCHEGQILGCSDFKEKATYVNITDGSFHSKILKINNPDCQIFNLNPKSLTINEITKDDIKLILINKKVNHLKFFDAKIIGIVVSTKPGQRINDNELNKLKDFLKDKEVYLFLSEYINLNEFENFNFIDYWINTACPRLSYDDAVEHKKQFAYYKDVMKM